MVAADETPVVDRATGGSAVARLLPGLSIVFAITVVSFWIGGRVGSVSALTVGVLAGAVVANVWSSVATIPASIGPGVQFAAHRLLRWGVVLLGFRLALTDIADLGLRGAAVVTAVVTVTFLGTRWLAARLGVSPKLGLLVATGYSICGASAIAAMDGVIDAEEEETAYAVALVTLCGSLSIVILPVFGHLASMSSASFGAWAGAAVHDVAQVIATASAFDDGAVAAAMVVKLTRVALLAPLVATIAIGYRRAASTESTDAVGKRPPLVPLFVVGFLVAAGLRSTGWIPGRVLADIKVLEKWLLTLALVALGLGVRFAQLRRLGGRPLLLGLCAWVLVAGVALVGVRLTG